MQAMTDTKIVVIGTGSWGTALAMSLHNANKNVSLWGRRPEHVAELIATHKCCYLPKVTLPTTLNISSDPQVISNAEIILWVAPVQQSEPLLSSMTGILPNEAPIIICSKGLELKSQQLLTTLLQSKIHAPMGVLSGPNFADEVAMGLPAAATLAFADINLAKQTAIALRHPNFRVYAHDDVVGVGMSGALKNVMAIAAGIVIGKELGHNCLAMLITRASAEIRRIIAALDGAGETCQTLAGIGDLLLTCSNSKSRNTSLGIELAKGADLADLLQNRQNVIEGVATAKGAFELITKHNIYAPIVMAVYQILYTQASINGVIEVLLSNQQQQELS